MAKVWMEAMVEEEDHQPLTQPIIEPPRDKFSMIYSKDIPRTFYSDEYMVQTMSKPQLLRNVSIVGALHHGKTILSDMLI
jgi:U5 small nuclear ribonucleoprotein component